MEIVAGPLDWTPTDAEHLATFLDTETGKRLIPRLLVDCPTLLTSGDVNAILIRSGEVRGVQEMVRQMLQLAHPSVQDTASSDTYYPPLEDDKAWNDGQKLTK